MKSSPRDFRHRRGWLAGLAVLLILKGTLAILSNYPDYFPPNFQSDFLRDREGYFFDGYAGGFWAHLLAGPLVLGLGLLQLNSRLRQRFPTWHRYGGRVQAVLVLGLLVPSGLMMAAYSAAGPWGGCGQALLAICTAGTLLLGLRAAWRKDFLAHRRWMLRNYTLLCSAVVLRVMIGLALVTGWLAPEVDVLAVWSSWIIPWGLLEMTFRFRERRIA